MEWLRQVVRDNSRLENILAVALAVFFFGGAFFVALSTLKAADWLSEAAAAWVQAIGAIASIWGTYGVARYQFRQQAKATESQRAMQIESRWALVRAVVYDSMEALGEARGHAMNEFNRPCFQLRPVRLEDCQFALRGLALQELPPGAVEVVLDILKAVSRTLLDVQRWYDNKALYPIDRDRFYAMTGRVLRAQDDVQRIPSWDQYWYMRQSQDPCSSAP